MGKEIISKYLVLCLLLFSLCSMAQARADDEVFTIKAKDLPISIFPKRDTLYSGLQERFLMIVGKGYQIDSITFINGSIRRKDDSIWLTPGNSTLTYKDNSGVLPLFATSVSAGYPGQYFISTLKIFGRKAGGENRLTFKKKFVVLPGYFENQMRRSFGGGWSPDSGRNDTMPRRPNFICFVQGKLVEQRSFTTQQLLDTLFKRGFSMCDTATKTNIGIASMTLFINNKRTDSDFVRGNMLNDTMKAQIVSAGNLSCLRFNFKLNDGQNRISILYLHKPFEPEILYDEREVKNGLGFYSSEIMASGKKAHFFSLREPGAETCNYKIKLLTAMAVSGTGKKAKTYKAKSENARIPSYLFNDINKKAVLNLDFVLTPVDTSLKEESLVIKRSYTCNYQKKGRP